MCYTYLEKKKKKSPGFVKLIQEMVVIRVKRGVSKLTESVP